MATELGPKCMKTVINRNPLNMEEFGSALSNNKNTSGRNSTQDKYHQTMPRGFSMTPFDSAADVQVEDCLYSWVIVFAASIQFLLVGGFHRSFGLILTTLSRDRGYSVSEVAVITAVYMTCSYLVAPFCGILCRRYSNRFVCLVGGLLASSGLLLSAFVHSGHLLLLTNGLVFGLGIGFMNVSSVLAVSQYNVKRRGLANAILAAAAAVGGIIIPPLAEEWLQEYDIEGCYILLGGCFLHSIVAGAFFRPVETQRKIMIIEQRKSRRKKQKHRQRVESYFEMVTNCKQGTLILDVSVTRTGHRTSVVFETPEGHDLTKNNNTSLEPRPNEQCLTDVTNETMICWEDENNHMNAKWKSLPSFPSDSCHGFSERTANTLSAALKRPDCLANPDQSAVDVGIPGGNKGNIRLGFISVLSRELDLCLLRNPLYMLIIASVIFYSMVIPHVTLLIPQHALSLDISRESSAYMIAVVAPVDILVRLLIGYLMDRDFSHKRYGIVAVSILGWAGVLTLALATSYAGLYVGCCLVVSSIGGFYAVMPVVFSDYFGVQRLSSTHTLSSLFSGVANLVAQPLCGLLTDYMHSFRPTFFVLSGLMLVAAVLVFLHPLAIKTEKKQTSVG